MKKISLIQPRTGAIIPFVFLLLLTVLNACKKEETESSVSYIRVVNTAPTLATYYPFLNSAALTTAALPYAGSTAFGPVSAGVSNLKFTTENNAASLLTKSFSLNVSSYNSFYLINKPDQLDGLMLNDDLSLPAADKAYIRYINLAPDAPALDLIKTGETAVLVANKAYKTASGFIAVAPGTYTFEAKETLSGSIKASSASAMLIAGYHYDIICGGLINPANDIERPINLFVLTIK